MPRFFVPNPPDDGTVVISGSDANHIGRSLRMRVGESLTVCCDRVDYHCVITSITPTDVTLSVQSECPSYEPDIDLTVYMAYPRGDKLEQVIQKTVELGASRICPVVTKRCTSRPDDSRYSQKKARLQKIALEAAMQSGRGIIPEVSDVMSFDDCISDIEKNDVAIVCYEKGGQPLGNVAFTKGMKIGVFVGSEGGFEPSEIDELKNCGVIPVWLGNRILRCETAPVAAVSIIMFLTDNM